MNAGGFFSNLSAPFSASTGHDSNTVYQRLVEMLLDATPYAMFNESILVMLFFTKLFPFLRFRIRIELINIGSCG